MNFLYFQEPCTKRNSYIIPHLSARKTSNKVRLNAIIGAIIHIKKNLLTLVFLKIFLVPNLATPIPNIAATFNCTNDVGIPCVIEANNVLTPQIAGHNLKNKLGLIKFGNYDNNKKKIYT